ncbi:MAG TPA: FAD:protein FMN transferase [Vicinamibacterales bacterium]
MTEMNRHDTPWRPSRRDALFLGIGGLIAAVPLARRSPLALVRYNVPTMGTIAEFAVVHRDRGEAQAAIARAVEALRTVDETMSRFRPASDVGRANLFAAGAPVPVCEATMDVLGESLWWAEASGGRFDPCLGSAARLWDPASRRRPPAAGDVARLANRQLFRQIEIARHDGAPAVRLHDADAQIDLGGIAKGYAVDRAVDALRANGVEHALVGAGGDLYALGRSPAGEPWRVGIQSPDDPAALAGALLLEDAAVATSGDYRQYFEFGARRYHHLLDPATGEPRQSPDRSVSVIAGTCMAADAGATLAFVMDAPRAERILARRGARVAHRI